MAPSLRTAELINDSFILAGSGYTHVFLSFDITLFFLTQACGAVMIVSF